MEKIIKNKHLIIGYLGMLILQSNNIPLIVQSIEGQAVNIYTPLMSITGLSFYLYYSLIRKDLLYTIGNGIGISLCAILILTNI